MDCYDLAMEMRRANPANRHDSDVPKGSPDHRKSRRFSDHSQVTFSCETVNGNGRLDNLSLGGAAILTDAKILRGEYLSLAIALPDQNDAIQIELAPVRWVKDSGFGVEFIRMASEPQLRLRRYVETLELASSRAA